LADILGKVFAAKKAAEQRKKEMELETQFKQAQIGKMNAEAGMDSPMFDAPAALGLPPGTKLTRKENLSWAEKQAELNANKTNKANDKAGLYANQFRDEFNTASKPFLTVAPMYKNVKTSAETPNPTAATDMNMIFAYMKILDPNSTVREGEYATAAKAGSFGDQVRNAVSQLENGQKLTPEQRANFLASATQAYKSQADIQKQHRQRYEALAKRHGVDPNDVVFDWGDQLEQPMPGAAPQGAPAAPAPAPAGGGYPAEVLQQAQEAANDPAAPPEVKAKAQAILRGQ
jgi:hypothetical protein